MAPYAHAPSKDQMPNRLTLTAMADLLRKRQVSAAELVNAHLRQIEKVDGQLKAFVMTFPSEARAAALRADSDPITGPLHGIPVTVKDSFDVRDLPTLCGSRLRLHHRASSDAGVVERLRGAGAIVLGKTNCPEFLANYETDNAITGWTANPWNRQRSAGGSSGGEAAAIAAFCSAGGVGSDGGGSIRVPAHFCGIAGLKPTPGRVTAAGHFPEISHPGGLLGVAGPMARTAQDLKTLFSVLAGFDPADPFSAPVPIRAITTDNVAVGVMERFCDVPVQAEAAEAVRNAAKAVRLLRIPAEEFYPAGIEDAPGLWWFFFAELPAPFTRELVDRHDSDAHWTGKEFVRMVPEDQVISGKTVVEKLGQRDRMRATLLRQMEKYPVLLLPACGVTAFARQERHWETPSGRIGLRDAMSPATLFNLVGFPSVVIPWRVTAEGLPVGIQLAGRPYEDELLLDLAIQLEEERGPFPAPPDV
jgi:Asp-tRNA(Asn)/Glu-tRNA(Gln) amidotransferase A subunit family amidase